MSIKKLLPIGVIFITSVIFFYKTFFLLEVPFPGDLLISEYSPWKYEKYLGYNPGSYPNKAQYFDVIRQLYPWKIFAMDEIKSGHIPLWNPYNFSGSPLLANNQSSVFYPLNILFFIFNNSTAWSIYIILGPFIASIFTYLYTRKIQISVIGSLVSSISFAFSLYFSVFFEYGNFTHTVLWVPIILFFLEEWFSSKKLHNLFIISFCIAFSGFAGHLQLFSGVLILTFYYAIIRGFHFDKKIFIMPFLAILLGVGICAVQLLPTFELISNSARTTIGELHYFKDILFQLYQSILFIVPDAYGNPATRNYLLTDSYPGNAVYIGSISLIFALYSLFFIKKTFIRIFSITALFTIILITNNPLTQFLYHLNLPFISSSSPSNFIFILTFSFSIMSGIGITEFEKKFDKKIFIPILLITVFLIFITGVHVLFHYPIIIKQVIFGALTFAVGFVILIFTKVTKKKIVLFLVPIFLIADLFFYFNKFNPFVPSTLVFPDISALSFFKNNHARTLGYEGARIEPNFQTQLRINSPEGYDPLYPVSYAQYLTLAKNGYPQPTTYNTRSDAVINIERENDTKEKQFEMKLLNELGVKYILKRHDSISTEHTFPASQFKLLQTVDNWQVIENRSALPRFFVTANYCNSNNTIYTNAYPGIAPCLAQNGADYKEIKSLNYRPGNIQLIKNSTDEGLIVVTENYYPGWKVFIDGKETKLRKVDKAFIGVLATKGQKDIIFEFSPLSFTAGLIITIISCGLCLAGVIFFRLKYVKRYF